MRRLQSRSASWEAFLLRMVHLYRLTVGEFRRSLPLEGNPTEPCHQRFPVLPLDCSADRAGATPRPSPLSGKRLSSSTLAGQIETTRRKGFAFSTGEKLPDSIGIAVPVRMAEERPIGSLTLTIPESRFVRSKLKAYVALLSEEAKLLSNARTW